MFSKVLLVAFAALMVVDAHYVPVAVHHAPQPYKFGYTIKDHHGEQHRQEVGDGHSGVKGSYGFTDARGIYRHVDYVADHGGFRAQVKTNEPGTANQDPADVKIISSANPHYDAGYGIGGIGYGVGHLDLAHHGVGYTRYGLGAGQIGYGGGYLL